MTIDPIFVLLLETAEEKGQRITRLLSDMSPDEGPVQINWVRSADEAKVQLQQMPFTVILLGLPLTKSIGDGLNILRQMNQIKPEVPVVTLVDQGTMGLGMQAVEFGAHSYFSVDQLTLQMLRRIIAKAVARRSVSVWQDTQEEGALSRIVLDALPVYVVIMDEMGRVTTVNKEWLQFAATTDNPLFAQTGPGVDLPLLNRRIKNLAIAQGIDDVLAGHKIKLTFEYPWQEGDHLVWYLVFITPMRWPFGGAVLTCQDITETVNLQIRLSTYQTEISELKNSFITTVHEFRTPLTNMHLYLDLIAWAKPERQRHYLSIVKQQTTLLEQYVNDLLDLSSVGEEKDKQQFTQVDFGRLIQHVVAIQQPTAAAIGLELTATGGSGPFLVNGNPRQLVQVIINLVANAIRYTEAGGVRVEWDKASNRIGLTVTDSGIGIAPEELPHIFESFFRSPRAQQLSDAGTGLGLAIVQQIVHNHGGSISVTSEVDKGSVFQVWLPAADNS